MTESSNYLEESFRSPIRVSDREPAADDALSFFHDLVVNNEVNCVCSYEELCQQFLETRVPAQPTSWDGYFNGMLRNLVKHAVNIYSPRCLGHMASVLPDFVPQLSSMVTQLNQNLVKWESSRSFTLLERQTLAMVHRLVYDESDEFYARHVQSQNSTLGVMASGGTAANIMGLWCARNAAFCPDHAFPGIRDAGLSPSLDHYRRHDAVVLASALAHYSIEKSVGLLGLGARNLVLLPVDELGRVRISALGEELKKCRDQGRRVIAIVGVAGTTDCGSIDPLQEMADIAQREGVHFHVDAAWAAPLLMAEAYRNQLSGIERADTVTIDGHKQFYLPIGTSMIVFRDPHRAHHVEHTAEYMLRPNSNDQGRFTLEGSRAGWFLYFHAALHLIGREGFGQLMDGNLRRTRQFTEMIESSDEFELLCEPTTNIVLYRYVPTQVRGQRLAIENGQAEAVNKFNERLQILQFERGATFVSRTLVSCLPRSIRHPLVALRAVLNNPLTTTDDMEAVLEDQRQIARELEFACDLSGS